MASIKKSLLEDAYYLDLCGAKFAVLISSNFKPEDPSEYGLDYLFLADPEAGVVHAYPQAGKEGALKEKLLGLDAKESDGHFVFHLDMGTSIREALAEVLATEEQTMSETETWNTDAQPKPLCCPRCGYPGPIEVTVECAKVRVDENGRCVGASGADIHPNNSARCCYCKHYGTVQTFRAFPRVWNVFTQRTQRVIRTVVAATEEEARRMALDSVFIYESSFERITPNPNIERVVELDGKEGSEATRLMLASEHELKKAALALLKQKEELVRISSPQYLRRFISDETLRLAQALALVKNEPEE